jgi:hypothetical protein
MFHLLIIENDNLNRFACLLYFVIGVLFLHILVNVEGGIQDRYKISVTDTK